MALPVPTSRAVLLAGLTLAPATLAMLDARVGWLLATLDLSLLALVGLDFLLAPRRGALTITRTVEPVLSVGRTAAVGLTLTRRSRRAFSGVIHDFVSAGPVLVGARQRFTLEPARVELSFGLQPVTRGAIALGPVTVLLEGPLGLCARRVRYALHDEVRAFPDLSVLAKESLELARAAEDAASPVQRRSEGREFESLREYRAGDDPRTLDWKATARRGRPVVRQYQPEENQQVLVLLDCGRHMAGLSAGRPKLDHAVDAALRLAKAALDEGDRVGVLAFGSELKQWLPPQRGPGQVASIARALSTLEATLEEADYGAALRRAFANTSKRSLVVVLTDLVDPLASRNLVAHLKRLVPRHVPVVASLRDTALQAAATDVPADEASAYQRLVARRLEREAEVTVATLREAGSIVVRTHAQGLGRASVHAYLGIKRRGQL